MKYLFVGLSYLSIIFAKFIFYFVKNGHFLFMRYCLNVHTSKFILGVTQEKNQNEANWGKILKI